MFEATLQSKLSSDGALAALLSTYEGVPAIFSEEAPETAAEPYIVYHISRVSPAEGGVQLFNIFVDYFDDNKSRANSRRAAERIEFLLDQKTLTSDRYDSIRISFESAGPVPDTDPRVIHHNLQFSARAGRKTWAQQLTEEA